MKTKQKQLPSLLLYCRLPSFPQAYLSCRLRLVCCQLSAQFHIVPPAANPAFSSDMDLTHFIRTQSFI